MHLERNKSSDETLDLSNKNKLKEIFRTLVFWILLLTPENSSQEWKEVSLDFSLLSKKELLQKLEDNVIAVNKERLKICVLEWNELLCEAMAKYRSDLQDSIIRIRLLILEQELSSKN